jgi:glycosyltransferase involved in cell wall biosynthesis
MKTSWHVVQLVPAMHSGGVETTTLEIAEALVNAGHRASVISTGGAMLPRLTQVGAEHVTMNIGAKRPWTLFNALRLAAWLRHERPDIVHVRSRLPAWLLELALLLLRPELRPKRISSVHGMNSVSRYSAVLLRGDSVIAVSQATHRYLQQQYPTLAGREMHVIEPGIDRAHYPFGYQADEGWMEALYQRHPCLRGKRLLCLPGRLSRLKGHQAFIDLLAGLVERGENVAGMVVGGEEPGREAYAECLYQQVKHRGLSNHIVFTGRRDDMREHLACSSLVLSLSNKPETFGRTVLEALSLGTPVLGWDHGGVHDLLAELCPEGRVPLNNQRALLDSCLAMLEHPPVIPEQHRFTLGNSCQKTLALYEDILT